VGLGDLTFGPLLQFRPIMSDGRPVFSHRVELDFVVPTGSYDPNKHLNQSSNFVSINPYWALTFLPLPHLELSVRFNYLYNFKNRKPALARLYSLEVPPQVEYAQAGQAGWVNFAASYEILRDLHLGANGYYFLQLNETLYQMRDGSSHPGRSLEDFGKTSFLGLGPGVMYSLAEHDKLFANLYFQLEVKNWPKGNVINLRWIHGF
jgi:hypothetical protein